MTSGGMTKTEAWNLQLQAQVDRLTDAIEDLDALLDFGELIVDGIEIEDYLAINAAFTKARRAMEGTGATSRRKFIEDFISQFVCWDMMTADERDEAVKTFVEAAMKLQGIG